LASCGSGRAAEFGSGRWPPPPSACWRGRAYNIDAVWARIAIELDEARLVQLDRLRLGQRGLSLRELADALGRAGRMVVEGIVKA
jgi:hypothetical protein